ncbi:antibiotic biosynthesis monooxygenase family protein [Roseibium sp.]|uniref:antibiotic biosynthesis monooxygenase family protein n=1 Tax=Roseibium sp. TaxID=1936156 RepID=UPI003A9831BB
MFVAMNRFRVNKGKESDFEAVWRNRDSQLSEMSGFRTFDLLKGPEAEDGATVLYASHTIWDSKADFVAWTKSEQFRNAHKNAGQNKGLYAGAPNFEGFESVL